MPVDGYDHFGGRHGESAAIKNLLAHAGLTHPGTGEPLSEALCFGIAGGIGAGYSFCPSVPRYGCGSGVSVVGRHKSYATTAAWYEGCFDRLGIKTRVTESSGKGAAYKNLVAELAAGRPTVVWCSRAQLPFFGRPASSCNLWMHSFVVYEVDEAAGVAHGADRSTARVSLSLDELAAARAGVCSHKNRTLTIEPPPSLGKSSLSKSSLTKSTLGRAVVAGAAACAAELLAGKMKTFSLPGLLQWAKMITNDKNKDGWLAVFGQRLMFDALVDVFDSIETAGTGGGLYRWLFADFLDEAAAVTGRKGFAELAGEYRALAARWRELADATLPDRIKPFAQTKQLLTRGNDLFEEQGAAAAKQTAEAYAKVQTLVAHMRTDFPLGPDATRDLLGQLQTRIVDLHAAETQAAERLQRSAA